MERRTFVGGALASAIAAPAMAERSQEDFLDVWQRDTDKVEARAYREYLRDGDTRSLVSLEKLDRAFDKVMREVKETEVGGTPAVWSLYNMGYVVKTRGAVFAVDLVHRRAAEFAPILDFLLVTHNHDDHFHRELYRSMNRAGKTVISNFLDNYGVKDWRRDGGFTRSEKVFKIKDTEIRTSLVDHNAYLVDFTTAFEIRVGGWIAYHTGDCGVSAKLGTKWGRPDLWMFFPGCGIDVADAVGRVRPRRTVFGHLWELGHQTGRLTAPLIRRALARSKGCGDVTVRLWGERIS